MGHTNKQSAEELALANYTQSWRLRAVGFDWPCRYYYEEGGKLILDPNSTEGNSHINGLDGEYSAPEIELALQYIREKHGIDCFVQISTWNNSVALWHGVLPFADESGIGDKKTDIYDKFPQASSAMLDVALSALEGRSDSDYDEISNLEDRYL